MYLIGICGKKGSGKDTAGQSLIVMGYHMLAFAGALKSMTQTLLNYLEIDGNTAQRMIHGDLKEMPVPELGGHSTRYAMQTLGTEWGRLCIDKDLWVNITIAKAQQYRKAVITDVRYPNEAKAIQAAGGMVVRLVRKETDNAYDFHTSEMVDNVAADHYLINDGTLHQLEQRIQNLVENYERRN